MEDQTAFSIFYCFTSVKGRTRVKFVKSCVKFTVTVLYKNVNANDNSQNSVILISTTLLGQEGQPRLMTTT